MKARWKGNWPHHRHDAGINATTKRSPTSQKGGL
jgi:hypothetical protein